MIFNYKFPENTGLQINVFFNHPAFPFLLNV